MCAEVHFKNLYPDFIIHLDIYSQYIFLVIYIVWFIHVHVTPPPYYTLTSEMLWEVDRKLPTQGLMTGLMALELSWEKPKSNTSLKRLDTAPRSARQLCSLAFAPSPIWPYNLFTSS